MTQRPYEGTAGAWLAGPDAAYRRFATTLIDQAPEPLLGKHILDVGAGAGAACRALLAAGAIPVAVDESVDMLSAARALLPALPTVAADATALPFRARTWDGAVSAFCINHLAEPQRLLREMARVVRPGGPVLASTYEEGGSHPAKDAVDAVLREAGWEPSPWHEEFQTRTSVLTATVDRLAAVAESAGLADIQVVRREVDSGLRTPGELVAWRLGMAELATFLVGLEADQREHLRRAAIARVGVDPPPLVRTLLLLVARAPQPPPAQVVLRAVDDDDLPILYAHQRDPVACQLADFPSREWVAFEAHWAKIRADPAVTPRAIVVDGQVVGNIGSWDIDGHHEVGYWIGRESWGLGYATAALRAFLALDDVRPMKAVVAPHNVASARVLERCGFTPTGPEPDGMLGYRITA